MGKEKFLKEDSTWINSNGVDIKYTVESGWEAEQIRNEIGISTNQDGITLVINEGIDNGKGLRSFEVKLEYIQAKALGSIIKHHLRQLKEYI